jgi:hypothetical protein
MSEKTSPISTGILVSSLLGAALLAIAGFSAMQPTGEQSKLVYDGKLWCVSNYLEQEPREILKDGRPRQDKLLDDKQDWIVREQVSADSKAEAEAKAQKSGNGLFEPSDKTALRAALSKTPADEKFFTSHFNQGATIAGPCLGGGSSEMVGMWLSDRIRKDCFGIESTTATSPTAASGETGKTNPSNSSTSTAGVCVGGKGVPEAYAKIFVAAGKKFNINPAWLATIFSAENGLAWMRGDRVVVAAASGWPSSTKRSWSTSSARAKGPMQFVDGTWRSNGQDGNGDGIKDVQNLADAIYSSAYLFKHSASVSGANPSWASMRRAAITYNCGPLCLKRSKLPPETEAYLLKVKEAFSRYNCP